MARCRVWQWRSSDDSRRVRLSPDRAGSAGADGRLQLGIEAHCVPIEAYEAPPGSIAVVTMANVIEHMPFPKLALRRAHQLLSDGGVLLVSTPNLDTYVWRHLDFIDVNPYWFEIEHYHNFTRTRLYALLQELDFAVVDYQINERYRTGMQVIARKRPRPPSGASNPA